MGRLDGQVALVTGAGEGIGRAIAQRFAAEGARVAVLDVAAPRAEAVADELGGLALVADVADDEAVGAAVADTAGTFGALHVLVNNAGIWLSDDGAVTELVPATWARTLAVNLTGVYLCCRHAIPHIAAAGGGSVVNVASPVALRPDPVYDAYTASKGGVIALSRSLAQHYGPQHVRVNTLLPGAIPTAMTGDAFDDEHAREAAAGHAPLGRLGRPEEVAAAALFLASPEASFVTGAMLAADGGWLIGA